MRIGIKMSRRENDYSHHKISLLDKLIVKFLKKEWKDNPDQKTKLQFCQTKNYRYYGKERVTK